MLCKVDELKRVCKMSLMIIAYIYERSFEDGAAMGAEKTFADYPKTNRAELGDMISGGGLVAGDVLRLRAVSDLGRGQESKRLQAMIADMGVTIELQPIKDSKPVKGRPTKAEVATIEQFDHVCGLWYSPTPIEHAIQRGCAIVGGDVDKNWFMYRCGPRSKRDAQKKRMAMEKKLNTKEHKND